MVYEGVDSGKWIVMGNILLPNGDKAEPDKGLEIFQNIIKRKIYNKLEDFFDNDKFESMERVRLLRESCGVYDKGRVIKFRRYKPIRRYKSK